MLKLKKKQKQQQMLTKKRRLSKQNIATLIAAAFLVLAHIAIVLAIIFSFRYYAVYPSLFGSIVCIIICLLIIIDIIFFVGFNHKDLTLKIVSFVLAVLMLIGGTVGSYLLAKTNKIVNNVLDSNANKYETYSGVFVCYDKYNRFNSIEDLKGKKVGMLVENTNGVSYIANNLLNDAKVDFAMVDYKTNAELMTALIDNDVDAVAITSAYRTIYSLERDENSPFAQYLDNLIDFNSFEQELKVDSNRKAKNLSTDPFNVLLIGYSRTDIGSTVGLADSIILASINPQTYTVSMMSIARDSFVPIACYGGEYDKINSGRSTSRACFIETVENFIGQEIDYYMELDYLGLVQIVDTIGGITINNPVEFTLDGIYVPAGEGVFADGQMALQFCRERHHMPNGDFDRQQHQKEVIIQIAKKFINSGDITLALKAMDAASNWMSTDLTLNQLTTVFNLLLNTKNYTSLGTFSLVDFQTLRITGSGGIKYYSYSMRLPLWVYLIYQGSYDESIGHMKEVLGEYTNVKQTKNFEFSAINLYVRPKLYSESYSDKFMFTPDPMPPYWATLEGMTYSEAMKWASENGVSLSVKYINLGDSNYNVELQGLVVEQSVRHGALISEYPSGTITIMGESEIDESKQVPNFVGESYSKFVKWYRTYIGSNPYDHITFDTSASGEIGKVISQSVAPGTSIENMDSIKIVVKAGEYTIKFSTEHGVAPADIKVKTGDDPINFSNLGNEGMYVFKGWYTSKGSDGIKVTSSDEVSAANGGTVTVYAKWVQLFTVTFVSDGSTYAIRTTAEDFPENPTKTGYIFNGWFDGSTQVTSMDNIKKDTILTASWSECTNHSFGDWVVTTEPTCQSTGYREHTCTKCKKKEGETLPIVEHSYVYQAAVPATCTSGGSTEGYKCKWCNAVDPARPIIPIPQLTEGCGT